MARSTPDCNPIVPTSGTPSSLTPCDQIFHIPVEADALTRATLPQLGGSINPLSSGMIGSGQIGAVHLASGVILEALSGIVIPATLTSGQVQSGHIGNSAVVSGSIASGHVGTPHLASGAISAEKIQTGAVTNTRLGALAVDQTKLANLAVVSGKIASGAVHSDTIASGAINTDHLSDLSVNENAIRSAAVTSGKIASGQVSIHHLASGVLSSVTLGSGSVRSGHLGLWAVQTENLNSGAVTQNNIAPSAVNSGHIGGGAVHTTILASGTRSDDARRLVEPAGGGWLLPSPDAFASGTWAVAINASGRPTIAVPGDATRMPAIGLGSGLPISGSPIGIVRNGIVETGYDTSGQVQKVFYVGASGEIAFTPPSGIEQPMGVVLNESGRLLVTPIVSGGLTYSGRIASGQISQFHFASGLVEVLRSGTGGLTSGAVTSGYVGNAAVLSGSVGSGQISDPHFASGATINQSERLVERRLIAGETISGRPWGVIVDSSGYALMASDPNFLSRGGNYVGVTTDQALSGAVIRVTLAGRIDDTRLTISGQVGSLSGAVGRIVWLEAVQGFLTAEAPNAALRSVPVGVATSESGIIVVPNILASGVIRSFALASGIIGDSKIAAGAVRSGHVGDNAVGSGAISSGQVSEFHLASGLAQLLQSGVTSTTAKALSDGATFIAGDTISGAAYAVALDASGQVLPAYVSSGLVAVGVLEADVLSGSAATVRLAGNLNSPYLSISGFVGSPLWVNINGAVVTTRPPLPAGAMAQKIGWGTSESGLLVLPDAAASGGIVLQRMGSGSVGSQQLNNGSVTSGKLGANSVSTAKIASGSIVGLLGGSFIVASGTFGPNDLGSGAVNSGHLGSGSVVFDSIASGQVQRFSLGSGAVTSGHVASGTITFNQIASGQVQANSLGSGAVVSGAIASGQIGGSHFASGTVVQGTAILMTTCGIYSGFRAVAVYSGSFAGPADAGSGLRLPAVGVTDFGAAGTASGAVVSVVTNGMINVARSSIETDFAASVSGLVGPVWLVSGSVPGRMTATIPASGIAQQRVGSIFKATTNLLQMIVMPDTAITSGVAGGFR